MNTTEFVCDVCGKKFSLRKSRRTHNSCYCSRKCMGIAERVSRKIIIKDDYAEMIMPNGLVALIDIDDIKKVSKYAWRTSKRTPKNNSPYYYVSANSYSQDGETKKRTAILLHRLIMDCPKGLEVDHLNHNPLDNRKSNLRICTRSENKSTRRKWGKK